MMSMSRIKIKCMSKIKRIEIFKNSAFSIRHSALKNAEGQGLGFARTSLPFGARKVRAPQSPLGQK